MEIKQVLGNTWYFEGKELIPFYRVDRAHCILLDSGLRSERADLFAALDAAGLSPVGVFGSHAHRDHSANHFALRERYGAQISLPQGEAAISSSILMLKSAYETFTPGLVEEAYGDLVGRVDETVGPEDGTVTFCGIPFRVLHTPGHSPDHISTVTPDGVCYLGDALFAGSFLAGAKLPYHYAHAWARESMEKLRSLSCERAIAAHNDLVEDLSALVDQNLELLDRRCGELRELLTHPMTLDELCALLFAEKKLLTSHLDKAGLYARNARTIVEYLVDRGEVTVEVKDGLRRYVGA